MKRDYQAAQLAGPNDHRPRHNDFNPNHNHYNNNNNNSNYNIPPAHRGRQLMSFQNYVRGLTSTIDEVAACNKYREFMADLSQSKVGRFFDTNKDREWFRLKYHPVESQKTLQKRNDNFLKRLNIFNTLNDKQYFDSLPYNSAHSARVLNLMDAIIVQLEDGPQELVDQLLSTDDTKIDQSLKGKFVPTKSNSVVIEDVNIETTLAEIQEVCTQADPALLRIAPLDPYYVTGGLLKRKIVAVYENHVDIKEVCWKLSRSKLNNKLMNVTVNKYLENRIKTTDEKSNHPISIVNDIRHAIILILNFDALRGLYGKRKQLLEINQKESDESSAPVKMECSSIQNNNQDEPVDNVAPLSPPGSEKSANLEEDGEKPFDVTSLDEEREKEKKKLLEFKFNTDMSPYRQYNKLLKSKNPLLQESYIYLVEFVDSAQARYYQERIAKDLQSEPVEDNIDKEDNKFSTIELISKNLPYSLEESTKFLDKMLWYLRIVHSFDYYKKIIYRLEDEMTLRMSVIHLRPDNREQLQEIELDAIKDYLKLVDSQIEEFGSNQSQRYVTKDEERFNYKSYGKVITDELAGYAQRIQKAKSSETEEVYKCKHCSRVFQKLTDIGRHFVSKHRWAVDAIEMETDFFNSYLFDPTKINPSAPRELLEVQPNRFAKSINFSQMGEDPDLLQQTIEAYNKMDAFVREPAPRTPVENDPRNSSIVDYGDISFDDAI